jgi:uncharacterized protein YbbC (DUF1343 family)/CubicO group peptidase (beta-lactamase class C family)
LKKFQAAGPVSCNTRDAIPVSGRMRFPTCCLALMLSLPCVGHTQAAGAPEVVFHADSLATIATTTKTAIAAGRTPGAVIWLERNGTAWRKTLGHRALLPTREPLTEDTIFDVASLTKAIATTTAVMQLVERRKLRLEAPLSRYLPEFTGDGKETITLRQLLTHHSGLRPGLTAPATWTGTARAIELVCAQAPTQPPGQAFVYSDLNFILLGHLVERVAGVPLDTYCAREIFGPLGMRATGFRRFDPTAKTLPVPPDAARIAPTEVLADGTILRGIVHDPTARRMGGVAGHAGLFLTASDLARFSRMLLGGGKLGKVRILRPETVALMTSVQSPSGSARRGFGWDIDSPQAGPRGRFFPIGSYGHTGWTGPSLWLDPFSHTFLLILSNRNHPAGGTSVLELRYQLATLAAEAVRDFNFLHVPGALRPEPAPARASSSPRESSPVLNGIDVLKRDGFRQLRGLRVGLVTNASGHDRQGHSTIDLLHHAREVTLVSLFSPEHGLRSDLDQAKIPDATDPATRLPVHSLYGEHRSPTPAQLAGLGALVVDLQDVGCRFYTYVATLTNCLEAAAAAKLRVVVLDRVNPIGARVEGPLLTEPRSFVGIHEIPLRHGMTLGELALLINAERGFGTDLTIVPCDGGNPLGWFDEAGQPWRNPSPNVRNPSAALLYPGAGLLECCKVSVGRGTDTPFEILGAPWLDELALARSLNAAALPGVRFTPLRFTPSASVFANTECRGVRLTITDRESLRTADLGMLLAATLHRMHPQELNLDACLPLLGDRSTLDALRSGKSAAAIPALWQAGLQAFDVRRRPYLLYERR